MGRRTACLISARTETHPAVHVGLALVLWLSSPAIAGVFINEIDVDQFGTDREEFVEIYNAGPGAIDFDASPHVLVFFNGGDATPPVIDGSYRAVALSGVLEPGFFLVVGDDETSNVDIVMGAANLIQNGADAVALYQGTAADWAVSGPPTMVNLVDAIVYGTDDEEDVALRTALGQTTQFDEWNGQGSIGAVFAIGRDPDGGPFQTGATPTPGASNDADPPLFALPDTTLLQQDAMEPASVTLRADGGVGGLARRVRSLPRQGVLFDAGLALTGMGPTSLPHAVAGPLTYLPDAGFNGVDTFEFDVVDGLGRVSDPAAQELAVQAGGVVISEVMHSPGTFESPQDQRIFEYVEVFNHTPADIELVRLDGSIASGIDTTGNLAMGVSPAMIPAWSMRIIAPGGVTAGADAAFRCEWGLCESDILRIPHDRYENLFVGSRLLLFGAGDVLLDAINLSPGDFWTPVAGASQAVKEAFLDLFGAQLDAAGNDPIVVWPYSGPGNPVGARVSYSGVGWGSPGFVPADYNEDFVPLPPCVPPPIGGCCLPDGSCAALTEVDCDAPGGTYAGDNIPCEQSPPCPDPAVGACCLPVGDCLITNAATCAVAAASYAGDGVACSAISCPSQFALVFNELDYNQAGFDSAEYIELHGVAGLSLAGFVLAFYNGGAQQFGVYRQIPLGGAVPADGYYVIGSELVPQVDLIAFTVEGIQNGDPDAIALIDPAGEVVDAVAYGGSFVAPDGPAAGFAFEDIGVRDDAPENDDPTAEVALQRIPNGVGSWAVTTDGGLGPDGTPGALNVVPLPAPFGACCLADGFCLAAVEAAVCTNAGGVYAGDASTCNTPCPVLIGACCLPNGECTPRTQTDCRTAGGTFFGAATSCGMVRPCDTPATGACCLAGGACVIEDAFDCAGISGDYRGDGSACADQDCGPALTLTINEIYRNDPSVDDQEFVELFGPGGSSLAGLAVVVIEGDHTAAGQEGRIDDVWLLDAFTIPGDGMFVLGDDGVAGVDFPLGEINQLENGTATILLIEGYDAFSFPPGTDIDLDDDGAIDAGLDLGTVIDGLAIADGGIDAAEPDSDRTYFNVVVLGPMGSAAPAGVARTHDGLDTESPADFCPLGEAGNGSDGLAVPTPGAPNFCVPCVLPGDGNNDGQVDLIDYAHLQACFTGAAGPANPPLYPPACGCVDLDTDGDVDLIDYAGFQSIAFRPLP